MPPPFLIGFLVPVRESGSLLPQLFIAEFVRRRPRRKYVWILGGILQALFLAGMALSAVTLRGAAAGATLLGLLVLFSLARGLVSVASKDVTGKTIPKTRRGRLTGFTTALSGVLTLLLGGAMAASVSDDSSTLLFAVLLGFGALLWLAASYLFATIHETPGATAGGRDAIREALTRLALLRTDGAFRRFVWVRALLVSSGLAAPFYVTLARESSTDGNLLGLFILASGLAAAVSSGFWGRYSDRSSRSVLITAASMAASLGVVVFILELTGVVGRLPWLATLAFFLLAISHSGIRVGRKTYLLDMADGARRTDYVAVSNSVIGLVLLLGGAIGLLASAIGSAGMLLVLSMVGFVGVLGGRGLREV